MFDRVSRLSVFNDNDMFEVRLSWTDDVGMVTQVMRAVTSHFPVSQPGLLEPLVTHVSRVLDDTAVCFYFFWYVTWICCDYDSLFSEAHLVKTGLLWKAPWRPWQPYHPSLLLYLSSSYMEKAYWYSLPNLRAHRYKLHTFRLLCQRCMKNTHKILAEIGALDEPFLNLIFVDMLSELLPEKSFYQVVSSMSIWWSNENYYV